MRALDWWVLGLSLVGIVVYGVWKSRGQRNMEGYLLADRSMRWWAVALSVMATQASAITFISTPGQAFTDGMRFVQFYFGLPLAMIVLCITAIPLYKKLNVYTAYEFLEQRFDLKTRCLAAFLFLIQRGMAAGLTIYAPSIILSVILGWDLALTNLALGGLVVMYTTTGGSKAVSWTQIHQVVVIVVGMTAAFLVMVSMLPEGVGFVDALVVAGKSNKLNAVDFEFDLNNRYSLWSGLIGGLFLQLSYFGTDQSQVGRYLSGQSVTQSRLGLLFNGIAKIPMQFLILFLGAFLFALYAFLPTPVHFNPVDEQKALEGAHAAEYRDVQRKYEQLQVRKTAEAKRLASSSGAESQAWKEILQEESRLRSEASVLIRQSDPRSAGNDTNYVFLNFVLTFLPMGLVGLVIAAIFAASMSSTSAELNALTSTTVVDVYKRLIRPHAEDRAYLRFSRWANVAWGAFAVGFAEFAGQLGSLIEAVNILGSLFYGTILGIFLVGFYLKRIGGTAVFVAAILAEILVIACYVWTDISFLWYNVVGCTFVVIGAGCLQVVFRRMSERMNKAGVS